MQKLVWDGGFFFFLPTHAHMWDRTPNLTKIKGEVIPIELQASDGMVDFFRQKISDSLEDITNCF